MRTNGNTPEHSGLLRSSDVAFYLKGRDLPVESQLVAIPVEVSSDKPAPPVSPASTISPVATHPLSPFATWLQTLKPATSVGTTTDSPAIASFPEGIPRITTVQVDDSGTSKKKRNAEDLRKSSPTAPPSLIDDIASETLAELLLSQGHREEAARMFERLAQQHPEKSALYKAKRDQALM